MSQIISGLPKSMINTVKHSALTDNRSRLPSAKIVYNDSITAARMTLAGMPTRNA